MNPFKNRLKGDNLEALQYSKHDDEVSMQSIGNFLLENKLLLSALEFYTECLERGTDLKSLRDFFSNPTNFEVQVDSSINGSLNRGVGSLSSFDSFDVAQMSDEGGRQTDEKVAVLEFELRKAKETIKSLRASLTKLSERGFGIDQQNRSEQPYEKPKEAVNADSNIKNAEPLECRAINFLLNEYLLNHNYKLTSITFCEENSKQDFEDWHDVGLNISKPPSLVSLYRNNSKYLEQANTVQDAQEKHEQDMNEVIEQLQATINNLKTENDELNKKNAELLREFSELNEKNFLTTTVVNCSSQTEQEEENVISKTTEEQLEPTLVVEKPTFSIEPLSKQTCERWVPSKFWKRLIGEVEPCEVEEKWLNEEVGNICKSAEELVDCVARSIPHIVPIMLLSKRDRLLPMLLATTSLNSRPPVRNHLLNQLFNLIKKPDQLQRQMILRGCVSYAKHVGASRTEEELLPQFWEQIGHKYSERRQLIAEACGSISPFLSPEIRSSLVLSILLQILQEEKVKEVKQSVLRSLAIVLTFLSQADKYRQVEECVWKLVDDDDLREDFFASFFPSFCFFAMYSRTMCGSLGEKFLSRLKTNLDCNNGLNEKECSKQVETLTYFVPLLYSHALNEFLPKDEKEMQHREFLTALNSDQRVFKQDEDFYNVQSIVGVKVSILSQMKMDFDRRLAKSDRNEDEVVNWLSNHFLPSVFLMLENLKLRFSSLIKAFIKLFACVTTNFGEVFLQTILFPFFTERFDKNKYLMTTPLFPVYVVGVLRASIELKVEEGRAQTHKFLFNAIEILSESELSIEAMRKSVMLIRDDSGDKYDEMLMQVIVSSSVHPSPRVRQTSALLLATMSSTTAKINETNGNTIMERGVIPTLLELSLDDNTKVRVATLHSFAAVAENRNVTSDAIDRVISQLSNMMTWICSDDDDDDDEHACQDIDSLKMLNLHGVKMKIANVAVNMGTSIHPRFRDQFLLPHLAIIAASNGAIKDSDKRSELCLALVDAFTNILCCFIDVGLLQGTCLPALKCIQADIQELHPDQNNSIKSLIDGVEKRLYDTSTSLQQEDSVNNNDDDRYRSKNPFQRLF